MPPQQSPLSFAQQRLWFLDQLTPGTAFYNVPVVLDLEGPLVVSVLERALSEIVRRHEPLRTVFRSLGGRPYQEAQSPDTFRLAIDAAPVSAPDAAAWLDRRIADEIRQPFDLATGPIFRASLVRVSATAHVLILVVHHISFDGWSNGVFFRELAALYDAFSSGRPSPLPDVPVTYREFAVRQREAATTELVARQMAFWAESLKAPRPTLALPGDRPRPAVQSHQGFRAYEVMSPAMLSALQDLSRREGVTLFMTALAAYATVLHALTEQDDLIIGTPIANRTRQDIEPLIGFFVNTLALRLDLSGDPSFLTLLRQAKRVALGAYANQDLPFERIVEELKPDRTLNHAPIAQAFLVLDNSPRTFGDGIAAADVVMRRRVVYPGTAKFDISVVINPREQVRRLALEVSADLFDEPAAARLLRSLMRRLEGIVADPDRPISRLPLIADADRRQVMFGWNQEPEPDRRPATIIDLFERQATQHPERQALLCGDDLVTYSDLRTRVRSLAQRLRRKGVGLEDRVGICVNRSGDLVVAVLAVLKAGGAYVPLDPVNPDGRLAFMTDDAGCSLLITDRANVERARRWAGDVVVVDDLADRPTNRDEIAADPVVRPDHLAYVMYTSGSTGTPKGVAIEHRQVVNLVRWAVDTFPERERGGMLASTSLSFDLSVFELFVPLCSGGTVILVDNLLALAKAPARDRVTFVNTVPSVMAEFLRLDTLPAQVAAVALAGEPLRQTLVVTIHERSADVVIYDLYGPTETTVYATYAVRTPEGPTTIGRPIANTTALILNESGELLPAGVAGELFIGGAGVGRGYWNRSELTAERFVNLRLVESRAPESVAVESPAPEPRAPELIAFEPPSPESRAPESIRLYRTGDRARWRSDGSIELLGRLDRQIKVRGFRIELGEVESVLLEQPAVRDAVVVPIERAHGVTTLVALIAETQPLDDDALYRALERRLPYYMVPTSIVRLPALPRLPNGKVDFTAVRSHAAGHDARAESGRLHPVVSADMRARLLEWAGESAPYHRQRTVASLFEEQARRTPQGRALEDSERSLTYAEVNQHANQLAHHIRSLIGRTPGSKHSSDNPQRVGILLERSIDAIVALLAVLKAGHAYVPLDPDSPPARIAMLGEQAGVALIVTRQHLIGRLPVDRPSLVVLDTDAAQLARYSVTDPDERTTADSLAYVLFTSGTTGTPKAVGVSHRAIVNLVFAAAPDVPLGPGETASQLAPLTFDAATFEIWAPLLQGGAVAVAPDRAITALALERFIARHQVTVMFLTTALFNAVIDERPEALANLRCVLTGGETASVAHVARAVAAVPRTRVMNAYGPTEATTFVTLHTVRADNLAGAATIPIGKPLPNTRVYVLDADRHLVAAGDAGELWIGGDGLADGYLNDAAQTAARFVADPFAGTARARMYRTGDQVRFQPNGDLEFLGRVDDQIKVRGFRIEPGEVEAALHAHPRVLRAVVSLVDLPVVGRALVAFVVPGSSSAPDDPSIVPELRDALRERLPEHMVPTQWVVVETIPLTTSGKTDRQALAVLARGTAGRAHPTMASPMSRAEEVVASIWCSVLGLSHVDRDQDFFDLGGHSLLATQVLSRVQAAVGVEVELRALFAFPTVAGFAREVERQARQHAASQAASVGTSGMVPVAARDAVNILAPIATVPRTDSLPLSFAQERMWFLHQWYGDSGVYNVPTAFRLVGALDVGALTRALQAIVDRHEALRTVLPYVDGHPVQRVREHVTVSIPLTDLSMRSLVEAEREALRLATDDTRQVFDLSAGPLFRCSLIRLADRDHVLLVTLHHIVADGWSLGVLNRELELCYVAERDHTAPPLTPLAIQYADFAAWQRAMLSGALLQRQLDYWRRQLTPLPASLDLPLDRARPPATTTRGDQVQIHLAPDLVERLTRFNAEERATLFVTLLAAYQTLLHHCSGQNDVCVGTPIANRTRQEIEPLIGCFVNTVALRADFSDDPPFRQLVRRTREATIDAQVHQDVPFEMLVETLGVERRADHSPIFQAMFALQEGLATGLQLADLQVSRVPVPFDFAKFELSLHLRPQDEAIRGALQFNADLFERETALGMAEDFVALLTAALDNPDQRVSAILLPHAKRRRNVAAASPAEVTRVALPIERSAPIGDARDIERRLVEIWQRVLDISHVSTTDNFFALGGHSLLAIRLFTEVEDAFGVRLPLSTLFRSGTIEAQARLLAVDGGRKAQVVQPAVAIQPHGRRPPFFLVHGVGGEVLSFEALGRHLDRDQPMFGLQAHGHDASEATTIEAVAARYIESMRTVATSGPYRLGGYSSGGVIAYEMAQQLRARGEEVALLALLDSYAPASQPPSLTPGTIWRLVKNAAYWPLDDEFLRSGLAAQRARLRGKVSAVRAKRGNRSVKQALDAGADVRDLLGLWKVPSSARAFLERYVRMMAIYRPRPYAGTVTVFRARTLSLGFRGPADLGWSRLAGSVTIHMVPGAHDTMLKEPRVQQLADRLSTALRATSHELAQMR